MALNRVALLLVALAAFLSAGCHDAMSRTISEATGLSPPRAAPPPEPQTLRTDDAPTLPPTPDDRVTLIHGPLDDSHQEPLGLLVVRLHSEGQFQTDALPELRKAAASLGAEAVVDIRIASKAIYGIATRAWPSPAMSDGSPAPGSIVLYAAGHPKKAFEPSAFVFACKPLSLTTAADALKARAKTLGATAVVDVRVTLDELQCDDSPLEGGGPFVRITGLAVRER